jgi:DNA-binding protein Fis
MIPIFEQRKELKGDGMTVYFENLDSTSACFMVPLYRITSVEQPLLGTVMVHDEDYYKSEKRKIRVNFLRQFYS